MDAGDMNMLQGIFAADWWGLVPDAGSSANWLRPMALLSDVSNLYFFQEINSFLQDEIDEFGINLLGRVMAWVGGVALTLMTLWIMLQGFRIVTGRSRDSMMALVTDSLRATLIVGLSTGLAMGGSTVYDFLTDDLSREISQVITGDDEDAYASIDRSLGYMQLAMGSIDHLDVGGSQIVEDSKTRALWFTGIGIAGPALTGGAMLLLNKIAMALFIGLGPVFILCLLFEQTKPLFGRWLFYGIGTMFSLAVLSVMVTLALDMVLAVSGAFWAGSLLGANTEGVTSRALQQGGLGLILTMLIISAPPIAATFFQGVLGNFAHYSAFGGAAGAPAGQRPGEPGFLGYGGASASPPGARPELPRSPPPGLFTGNAGAAAPQVDAVRPAADTQRAMAATSPPGSR